MPRQAVSLILSITLTINVRTNPHDDCQLLWVRGSLERRPLTPVTYLNFYLWSSSWRCTSCSGPIITLSTVNRQRWLGTSQSPIFTRARSVDPIQHLCIMQCIRSMCRPFSKVHTILSLIVINFFHLLPDSSGKLFISKPTARKPCTRSSVTCSRCHPDFFNTGVPI